MVNNKDICDIFTNYDFKRKKIIAFRLGMEQDKNSLEKLMHYEDDYQKILLLKQFKKGLEQRKIHEIFLDIRRNNEEYLEYYHNILTYIKKLSEELHLSNSLEVCILYTYLLYNGYLSSNASNTFQTKNRKNIGGMFFADVANGRGVCLNYSEYLKELLNICGYEAASIFNNIYIKERTGKAIAKLQIKKEDCRKLNKIIMTLENFIRQKNHVFTLVKDSDKYYIFDATNYLIFSVNSYLNGNIINGTGSAHFDIPLSYLLCYTDSENRLLDKILCAERFPLKYNAEDLKAYTSCNQELFSIYSNIIRDFYSECKEDIDKLASIWKKKLTKRQLECYKVSKN